MRAAIASTGLSLLFVVAYGATNWITTQRIDVGTWYYAWERFIPFVPIMIIPYLSTDLFFVAAPFLCRDRRELRLLASRIAVAIVLAAGCFLLFPLELAVERPEACGWLGAVFRRFIALDAPHNLLPSLHIALRVLLVPVYHRRTQGWLRVATHAWFFLIGLSTLLTHQHHVIDVGGGFLLAAIICHLFPENAPEKTHNVRVALYYGVGSLALASFGLAVGSWATLLLWPALSLALVALAYGGMGARVYRKTKGKIPIMTRLLLAPVLLAHELSRQYYRRECAAWDEVARHVWIGRHLNGREAKSALSQGVVAVVDLTTEFTETAPFRAGHYLSLPVLDLTRPTLTQLRTAVAFIEEHTDAGIVYVHCKIGYSRSVSVVGAYLLAKGYARTPAEAIERIKAARPSVVARPEVREALTEFVRPLPPTALLAESRRSGERDSSGLQSSVM